MSSHAGESYTERKSSWVNPGVWGIVVFILALYIFRACGAPHEEPATHKVEEKSHH